MGTNQEREPRSAPAATMRALVVTGPGAHGLRQVPAPLAGPAEALIAVSHVALCGTDFRLLDGSLHDAAYPVTPGHEWSGVAVQAPSRPELVGRPVVGHNFVPCGRCRWCRDGRHNLCGALDEVGFTRPGACAELLCVPAGNVRPLPDGVGPAAACLVEPLCVAVHAIDRAPALAGRSVAVLGAGAVGLLVLQLAVTAGATVVAVEPQPVRRELAAALGAAAVHAVPQDVPDPPPEVVVDATGSAAVFPHGVALVRPGGTYVLVGYSGEETVPFAPSTLMLKELDLVGVLSGFGALDRALAEVAAGRVRLAPLLGEPLPICRYRELLAGSAGRSAPRRVLTVAGAPPG